MGQTNQYSIIIAAPKQGTLDTEELSAMLRNVALAFRPDQVVMPYINNYTGKMQIGSLRFDEDVGRGTTRITARTELNITDPLLIHEVARTQQTTLDNGIVTSEDGTSFEIKLRRTTMLYLYPNIEEAKRARSVDLPYVPAVLELAQMLRGDEKAAAELIVNPAHNPGLIMRSETARSFI